MNMNIICDSINPCHGYVSMADSNIGKQNGSSGFRDLPKKQDMKSTAGFCQKSLLCDIYFESATKMTNQAVTNR